MNDLRILENLFEKHDDEIHFELFKRSNIISINIIMKIIMITIKKLFLIQEV